MGFRISKASKKWFKHIRESRDNNFDTDWDIFYYCLMAGLLSEQKTEASNTIEFHESYTKRYAPRAKLLIGLFLSKEIKKMRVSFDNKKEVNRVISNLIKPESSSYLTDAGLKEFNKYAYAGYEELLENIEDEPRTLEDFLIAFDGYVKNKGY
jgi:hypothetical protein